MSPKRLSSITKASKAYAPHTSRLLVFKFDRNTNQFYQTSHENMTADTNNKVFCLLSYDDYVKRREPIINDRSIKNFSNILHSILEKNPKLSFYGADIDTDPIRIKKEFSKFATLDQIIDKEIINSKIDFIELKYVESLQYYDIDDDLINYAHKIENLIIDKNNKFLKRLKLHQYFKNLKENNAGLLKIYESIKGEINISMLETWIKKNQTMDIKKINTEVKKQYPLLEHIPSYQLDSYGKDIAQYINMIDKL